MSNVERQWCRISMWPVLDQLIVWILTVPVVIVDLIGHDPIRLHMPA
jgi:hypothetical protein